MKKDTRKRLFEMMERINPDFQDATEFQIDDNPINFDALDDYDKGAKTKYIFFNKDDNSFRIETDYGVISKGLSFDDVKNFIETNKNTNLGGDVETIQQSNTFDEYLNSIKQVDDKWRKKRLGLR